MYDKDNIGLDGTCMGPQQLIRLKCDVIVTEKHARGDVEIRRRYLVL
jgi:hypothetical protein